MRRPIYKCTCEYAFLQKTTQVVAVKLINSLKVFLHYMTYEQWIHMRKYSNLHCKVLVSNKNTDMISCVSVGHVIILMNENLEIMGNLQDC